MVNSKNLNETDFEILAALDEHGRNVARNLSLHLGTDRDYLNHRLRVLDEEGLIDHIGPSKKSGLYEINATGQAALAHQTVHDPPQTVAEFLSAIEESQKEDEQNGQSCR